MLNKVDRKNQLNIVFKREKVNAQRKGNQISKQQVSKEKIIKFKNMKQKTKLLIKQMQSDADKEKHS